MIEQFADCSLHCSRCAFRLVRVCVCVCLLVLDAKGLDQKQFEDVLLLFEACFFSFRRCFELS